MYGATVKLISVICIAYYAGLTKICVKNFKDDNKLIITSVILMSIPFVSYIYVMITQEKMVLNIIVEGLVFILAFGIISDLKIEKTGRKSKIMRIYQGLLIYILLIVFLIIYIIN